MITPQPNDENASAANNLTSNNGLSFSCKQTFYHRFTRADLLLLKRNDILMFDGKML